MARQPCLTTLQHLAKAKHQRLLIHICGERGAALSEAARIIAPFIATSELPHLCLSDADSFNRSALSANKSLQLVNTQQAVNKLRHLLGGDSGVLIFDAYAGFNANVLGISSGCITAGSALILISPEAEKWPSYDDPDYKRLRSGLEREQERSRGLYLQRSADLLADESYVLRCNITESDTQWQGVEAVTEYLQGLPDKSAYLEQAFHQQDIVIEQICRVMTGHAKRPLIIEADRGRGKSAAMGIAAARLLFNAAEPIEIAICAPQAVAVKTFFHHALQEINRLLQASDTYTESGSQNSSKLSAEMLSPHVLHFNHSHITFWAADALLQQRPKLSLLMVDEAAAIPVTLLKALLNNYTRLVFATTVYGYEGNGRGFSLRFKPYVDSCMPQYQSSQLSLPIRWASGDRLEAVVNELLLLDSERHTEQMQAVQGAVACDDLQFKVLEAQALLDNPHWLNAIFALLVAAHYQTSGDDLRLLLDHPDLHIMAFFDGQQPVAVALIMLEGGFSELDKQQLLHEKRRFRGHILPQQGLNAGFSQALEYRYARVMRIAVAPALQRTGLGGHLLGAVQRHLQQEGLADFYGASFAAEADVVRFWQQNGFHLCVSGSRKDSSSGLYTVTVLKTLSDDDAIFHLHSQWLTQWQQDIPYLLLTQINDIDIGVAALFFRGVDGELSLHDSAQITAYCQQRRGFEATQSAMYRFMQQGLSQASATDWLTVADHDKIAPLLELLLLNRPWQQLSERYNYNGRNALDAQFRLTLSQLQQLPV